MAGRREQSTYIHTESIALYNRDVFHKSLAFFNKLIEKAMEPFLWTWVYNIGQVYEEKSLISPLLHPLASHVMLHFTSFCNTIKHDLVYKILMLFTFVVNLSF